MLEYEQPVFRPPSEGNNLIVQVTIGCSYNRCTFCSMYRTKTFRVRPLGKVYTDIDHAAAMWPEAHRVFLADGDALMLPTDHLLHILDYLHRRLPRLARVSCYALPANLLKKSVDELVVLKSRQLRLIYYGIETGCAHLLQRITKGATPRGMAEGLQKADAANLKVSATVILGLGGRNHWKEHVDGTIQLLNQVPVSYLSTLQLGLEDIVSGEFMGHFGEPFEWQDDQGMLLEQARLISGLNPPKRLIFRSNHASNALALAGTLPDDRNKLLTRLNDAQRGDVILRPRSMREY
ncbi:MAG: radical SAM protein [Gammaproteobacteria bacterium]|nr:radical SAM protein [Gammaproteobacteria bacterium]